MPPIACTRAWDIGVLCAAAICYNGAIMLLSPPVLLLLLATTVPSCCCHHTLPHRVLVDTPFPFSWVSPSLTGQEGHLEGCLGFTSATVYDYWRCLCGRCLQRPLGAPPFSRHRCAWLQAQLIIFGLLCFQATLPFVIVSASE